MLLSETNCTVSFHGHEYSNNGAFVVPTYATCYIAADNRHVTDWHGDVIGTCRMTAEWETPRSLVASTMRQYRVTIDGTTYTGRSVGEGFIFRGKPVKS